MAPTKTPEGDVHVSKPIPSRAPVPVFLFSLPRSGSTLLQRILATHPEVATGPEPSFLLPLLNIGSSDEVVATFDQRFTAMAVEDFLASTDDATETFDAMARAAAEAAYSRAGAGDARYFVDKTPKYHMVADDILRIFPEAPAIVIWRNPLAIIASLMGTWGGGGGRWNLQHFRLDLFQALPQLIDTVGQHADRIQTVRYEDLVHDADKVAATLFDYLDVDAAASDIALFNEVELDGRIQDPNVATEAFHSVRSDRVDQWTTILANPIRKRWCRRYLTWLGPERMAAMGYDLDETLAQLDALKPSKRFLASDMLLVPYDTLYRVFELGIFGRKLRAFRSGQRPVLAHK